MPWFETFFDEDYLRVFGPFVEGIRAQEEATHVMGLLGLPGGARVLDLACGQGRHAVRLRQAGLQVVGLDLSQTLLQAARDRDPGLPVARADMRSLPLATGSLDGVVNLFNAFGYFETVEGDLQVLREVARVLRPGGVLVQEVHHRDALVRSWEPRTIHPMYADGMVLTEDREWDPVSARHRVTYELRTPDGVVRRSEHVLRVYTLTELVALHERAGLVVMGVHGDLAGAEPTHTTPLGVVVSGLPG